MGATDLLAYVRAAGFTLDLADDRLLVTPASMLTDFGQQGQHLGLTGPQRGAQFAGTAVGAPSLRVVDLERTPGLLVGLIGIIQWSGCSIRLRQVTDSLPMLPSRSRNG